VTPPDRSRGRAAPNDRPSLSERRSAALERRRRAAHRRRFGIIAVVLLVAAGVAACTTITHHVLGTSTSSTRGGTTSTSTTVPKPPSSYNVGLTTFDWKDSTRGTLNPTRGEEISGRVLTTQVRYPTLAGSATIETAGAAPAKKFGPFPVIVFAHGYDVSPLYYEPLLDAWVHAGFIVVSPIFPDENTATVGKYGGPTSTDGSYAENDVYSEPGDIAYVLKQFDVAVAKSSGTLAGLADISKLALAGQSDGANVVAALAYGSAYTPIWQSLPQRPKAVAVLSGQAWSIGPGEEGTNTTAASASSPAVLQVQSATDTCNPAQLAADLFSHLGGAPVHLFETLTNAAHLAPYVGGTDSAIVEKVTTEFFELMVGWRSTGLTMSGLESAATDTGVSSITSEADTLSFGGSPAGGGCVAQLPTTSTPTSG
jgi:hypothetical protein